VFKLNLATPSNLQGYTWLWNGNTYVDVQNNLPNLTYQYTPEPTPKANSSQHCTWDSHGNGEAPVLGKLP
jgi:hypothetical protein